MPRPSGFLVEEGLSPSPSPRAIGLRSRLTVPVLHWRKGTRKGKKKIREEEERRSSVIEINALALSKRRAGVIISPLVRRFHCSICLFYTLRHGKGAVCHTVDLYEQIFYFFFAIFRVYRRLSKRRLPENPIKGDVRWSVVLFKAFWDISGWLRISQCQCQETN